MYDDDLDEYYGIAGLGDPDEYIGDELAMYPGEVGRRRRRGLRRFGRGLGFLATGGLSEGIRRARRRGRSRARSAARHSARPVTAGSRIIAGSQRQAVLGLGFAAITAGPGTTGTTDATVQRPFQPQRLVVTTDSPVNVTQVLIGTKSQLAGVEEFPSDVFAPTAFNTALQFDPAGPGIDISVRYVNQLAVAAVVNAAMLGVTTD